MAPPASAGAKCRMGCRCGVPGYPDAQKPGLASPDYLYLRQYRGIRIQPPQPPILGTKFLNYDTAPAVNVAKAAELAYIVMRRHRQV